jgi:hypothetical protein
MTDEEDALFVRIEARDSSISRDAQALSHAESKHLSADLWARIRLQLAERRELYALLDGHRLN